MNDNYYLPELSYEDGFIPYYYTWDNSHFGTNLQNRGWVFRTKEECEAFCKRLDEAIEGVKP